MYSPELQRSGEISSGVDVWAKKVSYPVIEKWYDGHDYHSDSGEGLDFYKVGPSRGCGGLGIYENGNLYVSKNYSDYEIISRGPIRCVFELEYKPWQAGEYLVKETKRISLDKGSNLSRFEIDFDVISGGDNFTVAAGIVKRDDRGQVSYNLSNNWLSYQQPRIGDLGIISCGIVIPEGDKISYEDDKGHCLLLADIESDNEFVYYAGACWNKSGQFENISEWNEYLSDYSEKVNNPVEVQLQELK